MLRKLIFIIGLISLVIHLDAQAKKPTLMVVQVTTGVSEMGIPKLLMKWEH
jgi:hypothetical protein